MVYFITGPVCSGKSTRLLKLYNTLSCGDGFYNIRRFNSNQTIGQDLVQLSTEKCIPFSRIKGFIPDAWDESICLLNYSFSKRGLEFAENIIEMILKNHCIAFIDELGPLELEKKGLFFRFKRLLQEKIDIYAVCRTSCLSPIINSFEITDYYLYTI